MKQLFLPVCLLFFISIPPQASGKEVTINTGKIIWSEQSCEDLITDAPQLQNAALIYLATTIAPKVIDFGLDYVSAKLESKTKSFQFSHSAKHIDSWGKARQIDKIKGLPFDLDKNCLVYYSGESGKWLKGEAGIEEKKFYPKQIREGAKPDIMLASELVYREVGERGVLFSGKPLVY